MNRAAALSIAFACACAARHQEPAEPLEQPTPQPRPVETIEVPATLAGVARPKESVVTTSDDWREKVYEEPANAKLIAQIDPHAYERWPLGHNQHPSLEPAYAIASVFASPGVSWLDLCRMGAQNRRGVGSTEQLEYLRAWCDVAKRDAGAAIARLKPLVNSGVLGMPAAVRTDIANIVVDAGDADHAQALLSRAQVDDLAVYDLAAAGYVEVGKVQDAIALTDRSIAAHDARRPLDHCMRIARKVVLVDPGSRTPLLLALGRLNRCEAPYRELLCWHKGHCDPYLVAHGVKPDELRLGELYKNWPSSGAPVDEWLRAARIAEAVYRTGREEAALRAIENGLRTVHCTGPKVPELVDVARGIASSIRSPQQAEWDLRERLLAIATMPDVACAPN